MEQTLYLTEIFTSVQGETTFAGLPTVFIRLSGCNLRCNWCDTTYSFKRGIKYTLDEICNWVSDAQTKYICITGGEPLLQKPVYELMNRLLEMNKIISLETSGSISTEKVPEKVHVILDIKCPGSGMDKKNYWNNIHFIRAKDEVKFVLTDRADFDWMLNITQQHQLFNKTPHILLSPAFGSLDAQTLVKWILESKLPFRLNLQLHKYIWTPTTKGV